MANYIEFKDILNTFIGSFLALLFGIILFILNSKYDQIKTKDYLIIELELNKQILSGQIVPLELLNDKVEKVLKRNEELKKSPNIGDPEKDFKFPFVNVKTEYNMAEETYIQLKDDIKKMCYKNGLLSKLVNKNLLTLNDMSFLNSNADFELFNKEELEYMSQMEKLIFKETVTQLAYTDKSKKEGLGHDYLIPTDSLMKIDGYGFFLKMRLLKFKNTIKEIEKINKKLEKVSWYQIIMG